jgi:predicted  nucleic acid-binding Zn-ribbon protein
MLSILSNSVTKLENAAANARANLDKIKAAHELAVQRASELERLASEAIVDAADNAEHLAQQHGQAEARVRSQAGAITLAEQRLAKAEKELSDAKAKAKAEAAAATMETATAEFEKAVATIRKHLPTLATAMDGTSFTSIATLNQHARFLAERIHHFNAVMKPGGDAEKWISDLRVRAELVRGGGVSSDIGKTEAENQRERAEALKRLAS